MASKARREARKQRPGFADRQDGRRAERKATQEAARAAAGPKSVDHELPPEAAAQAMEQGAIGVAGGD